MRRLLEPDMDSGWGIRTLAMGEARFDPESYHNGSVWPHDTMLAALGMAAAGFDEQAGWIAEALVEAATALGGSLPEVFSGAAREEGSAPEPYAASCHPQAWAAAALVAAADLLDGRLS